MSQPIFNAGNLPLSFRSGTVSDLSGAMTDWFQPMVFSLVGKFFSSFQLFENATNLNFRGVIQPLSGRKLELKPEGQRTWTWLLLHAEMTLQLDVDDVVTYKDVRMRVMTQKDFSIYGFYEYELVQDWEGSSPVLGSSPRPQP